MVSYLLLTRQLINGDLGKFMPPATRNSRGIPSRNLSQPFVEGSTIFSKMLLGFAWKEHLQEIFLPMDIRRFEGRHTFRLMIAD
jgi:hypothetical protein